MRSCATADRSFKFPSTWAWQSIKPGNTVKPVRSTTLRFPEVCCMTAELGPISTIVAPLIRIACSFAIEPLLMSSRRVVLIRIGSLGCEAANAMPIATKGNNPTEILRIMIPPRNGQIVHRAGLRTANPIRARLRIRTGYAQEAVPSYLQESKVASFWDDRDDRRCSGRCQNQTGVTGQLAFSILLSLFPQATQFLGHIQSGHVSERRSELRSCRTRRCARPNSPLFGGAGLGPNIISRNLTPDNTGNPEVGNDLRRLIKIMKTGHDFDTLHLNCGTIVGGSPVTDNCYNAPVDRTRVWLADYRAVVHLTSVSSSGSNESEDQKFLEFGALACVSSGLILPPEAVNSAYRGCP